MNEDTTGRLSVVATPIGNMEDITLRALAVLTQADYILAEDTRVTGNLLKRHAISNKLVRYDAHSSDRAQASVLEDLSSGKHVAMVSDAGTPGISDPGVLLVSAARAQGARVDAIPGPSAVTAAISIAGLTGNQFTFLGFAPQKKGRETFFKILLTYEHPVAFFESTHRIIKTLTTLASLAVDGEARLNVTIARELTKMHEEVVIGTPAEVLTYFETHSDHQKGEFVVIVSM